LGSLTRAHWFEAGVFLAIVAIFYVFSFEFNQPIEIYRYGATAWPRVIIGTLLLATIGNIWFQYKHGSASQVTIGQSEDETDLSDPKMIIRMAAVLLTPLVFAWLLKPVGIYASAPFFLYCSHYVVVRRTPMESNPHYDGCNLRPVHRAIPCHPERTFASRQRIAVL